MASSVRQFNIELYLEHLEEASFLYDQRLAYLRDPELDWPQIAQWEERLNAHLDALVVGSGLALDVCRRQAIEGDYGEMHAAMRVFCRQNRADYAFEVLNVLDGDDNDTVFAAARALRYEAPPSWKADFLRIFQGKQQHLTAVLADVIGYRRFDAEDLLVRKLSGGTSSGDAGLAWALGRVGSEKSIASLRPLLDSDNEPVCTAAALALLRLGDDRPLGRALLAGQLYSWPRKILGIAGDRRAVNILLDALNGQQADHDTVLALGLLGDLAAVAPLVAKLDDEELATSAATALNTITGANAFETVFVPDEFDPDDLFDDERKHYEATGELPKRADGEPYGSWERQPICDAHKWRAWLGANKTRFDRKFRWRMGMPYGPIALLASLKAPTNPYDVRAASYEELTIRYAMNVPFEVDLPVHQQQRFLVNIEKWVRANERSFSNGGWYFAGKVQAQ